MTESEARAELKAADRRYKATSEAYLQAQFQAVDAANRAGIARDDFAAASRAWCRAQEALYETVAGAREAAPTGQG